MSDVRWPMHEAVPSSRNFLMSVHEFDASFSVHYSNDRVWVELGSISLQLMVEQARVLRGLLDAGLADAEAAASAYRVDLTKAVA
ncbi:hypothetical protein ACFYT3_05295 [Nocardia amikacinitolerans]|uniref:hypothetical protein n=1 Tax=Nocardia amikacinitolerans TaxID=756689 RepID=UPI0036CA908E